MPRSAALHGQAARARLLPEALALLAILGAAGWLRLANLSDNPGWYTDEATHLEIARHLIAGRVQYFALGQSFLLFGRPPLFELLLAGAGRIWGVEMAVLRGLTGALGVLTVALLYGVTRRFTRQGGLALLAAFLLAIDPQAVLYSRFGFSYNLLAPVVLASLLMIGEYMRATRRAARWAGLILLGLIAGIGLLCDVMMIAWLPVIGLIVAIHRRRDVLPVGLGMALPPAVYAAIMLLIAPDAFRFDLAFTLSRMGSPLIDQASTLAGNLAALFAGDIWFFGGLIGVFLLRQARLSWLVLAFWLIPLALVGRVAALRSLSAYYLIPVLPFTALGIAVLLWRGGSYIARRAADDLRTGSDSMRALAGWGLAVVLIGTPLLAIVLDTAHAVRDGFPTAIDPFLVSGPDARAAARFVNERIGTDDVAIASPAVGWLIDGRVADLQMAVAAGGEATPHLPADIPPERWLFDPRFEGARFIVVDNLWRNWGGVHIPAVANLLGALDGETPVFAAGAVAVYENPAR